jgi:meso-butanediol dehydrogenase/(S,S)-butanediol dehydrogenase/diacetyl reductase
MDLRFDGKTVVVVGGSTGIGKATVREFSQSGGTVVFTGVEPSESINIQTYGAAEYCRLDVTDEQAVRQFADRIEVKYGGADVLFNNAGILIPHCLHECTSEEWDRSMNVNARGAFLGCKYFIPQMIRKGGGAIVNTSSMSGLFADDGFAGYNASKGAVANLTRSAAVDYAKYGIRVNAVNPGSVRTSMYYNFGAAVGGEEVLERGHAEVYPLGRIGLPEEIAACVLFLASDRASFVTGHNLLVDGGITAHSGAHRHWERVRQEVAAENRKTGNF